MAWTMAKREFMREVDSVVLRHAEGDREDAKLFMNRYAPDLARVSCASF